MEMKSVLLCFTIILMLIYSKLSFLRIVMLECWGESFDDVSYKCASFDSSVKICDIQLRKNCSENLTMEYHAVLSYIWWSRFTQVPLIITVGVISCVACWRIDSMEWKKNGFNVALVSLLTEAMQVSNYVLILTLVGPANGFMPANTTTSFRVLASIDGLLTGLNLAVVIAQAIQYCQYRSSQFRARPSRRIADSEQPPLALIRVEYEKAVRNDSGLVNMPTTMKIKNICGLNETDLRDEFPHVLQQLWKEHAHLIGKGKDAKGLAHSCMDIQRIRLVDNQYALSKYSCRRQAICDFSASVGGNLRNLHEYKNGCGLVFQTQGVDTDNVFLNNSTFSNENLSNNVDKRINEYYLFHGTLSLNSESIAKHGFDVNKCKERLMLGRGIYFTDSLVKADQYTQPDDSGMCCVIMARVLLGDFVVATNSSDIPSTSRQPPCKECMTTVCKNTQNKPHPRFDAVVYTGGLYKEFVVYNNWQAYPEFIIFYKRL